MSRILNDLVNGELQQMGQKKNTSDRFSTYLDKTYNKTASLMANSCQAVAHMAIKKANPEASLHPQQKKISEAAYLYGKNMGIAFQLIDDWLDFVASAKALGKPAAADLK
jgi:decaprenyl-diphosphate synthase subunit 1